MKIEKVEKIKVTDENGIEKFFDSMKEAEEFSKLYEFAEVLRESDYLDPCYGDLCDLEYDYKRLKEFFKEQFTAIHAISESSDHYTFCIQGKMKPSEIPEYLKSVLNDEPISDYFYSYS